MSTRRVLFATSALFGIAACTTLTNITSPTTQAAIARVVSYVQAGVSSLESVMVMFGAQIPVAARKTATVALDALSAGAGAFGTAISSSGSSSSMTNTANQLIGLFKDAVEAVVAGLSIIPNPSQPLMQAIEIASAVVSAVPVVQAFIAQLNGTPVTVGAVSMKAMPGIMVP